MFKAIIFDMDGVIVDSEPTHYAADTAIFKKLGLDLSYEERKSFLGQSSKSIWEYISKKYSLELSSKQFLDLDVEIRKKFLLSPNTQEINPGLEDLLKRIQSAGIPMAVASSSVSAILEPLLKELNLAQYFLCFATGDQVPHAKPAPDVFLLAAELLKTDPSTCLVLEDSPNGIKAAKAAGMTCIAYVPRPDSSDLSEADSIIRNFNEFDLKFIKTIYQKSVR
jgi:beta-phosphoglucomutase family hydrolase